MLATIWFVTKIIFWIIFLSAFLTALTTHFVLWFELRLKSMKGELPSRIPYFTLFKSLLIETACYCIHPLLLPLAYRPSAPPLSPTSNKNAIPVLLVHGYLQNKTVWLWFHKKLRKIPEIGPLYNINLFPPFCSIAQHSDTLKKEIERIKVETQQNKIILVGHSMGGLAASYYTEYLAKPNEVEKVIALGSPFQGTRLVALGFGACVKEMAPQSAFLQELTQRIQHSSAAYYYVGSQIDNLILPWTAAFPPDQHLPGKNKLILEDYGHLRLLVSPRIVDQLAKWITTPSSLNN